MSTITPPPQAPGAFDQRKYPGAGDVDDCWVVATVYAAKMYDRKLHLPTIPEFRKAAGVPDVRGVSNGGTVQNVLDGAHKIWPHVQVNGGVFKDWAAFVVPMQKGLRPASLAVKSSELPPELQYGFKGLHQVAAFLDGDQWWISNPLQRDGAKPDHIGAATLRKAAYAFGNDGHVHAALFPVIPVPVVVPPPPPVVVPPPGPTVAELQAEIVGLNAMLTDTQKRLIAEQDAADILDGRLAAAKDLAAKIGAL